MSWLSPGTMALAVALTIPPLIALYFLKLKRRVVPIASTLLWKRAVHDLQVNAPFQKLRRNLLLLLQLLILVLAAVALGQPVIEAMRRREKTIILMVDQSASMNVVEASGRSRLELAKEQARRAVDVLLVTKGNFFLERRPADPSHGDEWQPPRAGTVRCGLTRGAPSPQSSMELHPRDAIERHAPSMARSFIELPFGTRSTV